MHYTVYDTNILNELDNHITLSTQYQEYVCTYRYVRVYSVRGCLVIQEKGDFIEAVIFLRQLSHVLVGAWTYRAYNICSNYPIPNIPISDPFRFDHYHYKALMAPALKE